MTKHKILSHRLLISICLFCSGLLWAQADLTECAPDRIIVKFKPNVSMEQVAGVLGEDAVKQCKEISTYAGIDVLTLNPLDAESLQAYALRTDECIPASVLEMQTTDLESELKLGQLKRLYLMLNRLNTSDIVEYAELDFYMKTTAIPNDSDYNQLYGMPLSNAPAAWDVRTDASSVVVAVVDTGVNYNHPDLVNNMWRNPGEIPSNGIDDDNNGHVDDIYGADFINLDGDPNDDNSHGSHVAGTIAAEGNNSIGVTGVAWKAKIMAIKSISNSNQGSFSAYIAGISYAIENGAKVINASFGGTGYSFGLRNIIEVARENGVIMVCASGNGSSNVDATPFYPASYLSSNVVAVNALRQAGEIHTSTNFGLKTDLFAPGKDIRSTGLNSSYITKTGTSMAAPHVSGAVALLIAQHPADSMGETINRLLNGALISNAYKGKAITGGRLDIAAALSASPVTKNDSFENSTSIPSAVTRIVARMTNTTIESGEPQHGGVTNEGTVWYKWTPNRTSPATVSTFGSNADTTIGIYEGESIHTLTLVGSNDDNLNNGTVQSQVSFLANETRSYMVAIGIKSGGNLSQSNVEVSFNAPQENNLANAAPTDLFLSKSSVNEYYAVGSIVGFLSAVDQNLGDIQTYTLSGPDASAFRISANQLQTAKILNSTEKNSFSITIRATDLGGLFFEKSFVINVLESRQRESLATDIYQSWKAFSVEWGSVPETQRDALSDPDGDGLPNLVECIFQTDPTRAARESYPQTTTTKSEAGMSIKLSYPKLDSSVLVGAQTSTSLGGWEEVENTPEIYDPNTNLFSQTITFPLSHSQVFYRLKAGMRTTSGADGSSGSSPGDTR